MLYMQAELFCQLPDIV